MKELLVVGDDKIGHKLLAELQASDDLMIVLDRSSSLRRVVRLVLKGSLQLQSVVKMLIAELGREDCPIPTYPVVKNNEELLNLIEDNSIDRILLFRAGLIVSRRVLDSVAQIWNIHCARIPEYGGLGVIQKALDDRFYDQEATLHVVTDVIDQGEVLDVEPYQLQPHLSYKLNEEIAYDAGVRLAVRVLRN